ncbi:MAG: pentapeptide repeat-containing protein [Caldilineaceae bacterium]|nr:pentapeptide repeat-containing protein [Caldilineaceae bacterium]
MSNLHAVNDTFIDPGVDIDSSHPEIKYIVNLDKGALRQRWNEKKGQEILARWKSSDYNREILDNLVGKFYGHTDLRGIDLSDENLSRVDLSSCDMYASNLQKTDFSRANLQNSYLSESNVKGAKFDWSRMEGVLLDNVDYDHATSFLGIDLNSINFTLSALLQEMAIGQQRIEHLKERQPFLAKILWVTCDYGRSFSRFLAWCIGIILAFALAYWLVPGTLSHNGLLDSIYFSVITFVTLGFSDISPISWSGRFLTITEVFAGYFMMGLLVAMLSRKVVGQ